jgi:hypothetical protein
MLKNLNPSHVDFGGRLIASSHMFELGPFPIDLLRQYQRLLAS